MKSVVLSTTEAEYMALSEVVKELKFIVQLLETMNIEVELPITVHVDNVGAIWLSNNRTTSDRTKHIDIRTSFVKEYQEDGKIIIKFVKSEENEADIFTKNTTDVIFSNHQQKLVWDKTNVDSDDTFYTKIPIAPCYCQMMGRALKEEIRITQSNNPTKAGKYSLEDLFRASDNIPHHYPKF